MAQRSFGEAELSVSSWRAGLFRVLGIFADSAIYPRLTFTVGVVLHDRPSTSKLQEPPPLVDYELRDISGELRLAEHAKAIGRLYWTGQRILVRSGAHGSETQLQLTCDLDFWRLEEIERLRNGAGLKLWVQLWPLLTSKSDAINADIRPFEVELPREQWLEVISRLSHSHFDIFEIQYSAVEAKRFERAIVRTREAREKIGLGDFDEAVALCRNVIEALARELPTDVGDGLLPMFVSRTDEKRAKEYVGIISRIKQLAAFAHHEFGTPLTYSRAEALFAVRITESILALVGALTSQADKK